MPPAVSARPGKGEVKGFKAIYDPDLDKALKGREKRSRQVQFSPFGEEVCLIELRPLMCSLQGVGKLMDSFVGGWASPNRPPVKDIQLYQRSCKQAEESSQSRTLLTKSLSI